LNTDPNASFHFVSVSLDLIEVSFDIRGGARGRVVLSLFFEHGFMGPFMNIDSLALF